MFLMKDHAIRCGLEQGLRAGPVICVGRKGSMETLKSIPYKKGMFYLIESHDFIDVEVSSTLIRQRIQNKEGVDDLTDPKVAEYLKQLYKSK